MSATPSYSAFASGLTSEIAFDVLVVAKKLKAAGKDVIELQLGDSPFPSTKNALAAGTKAIADGHTHYCASLGLPQFREVIAETVRKEFDIPAGPENIVVGPGAKVFETYFCELFIEPGDEVLLFSPQFPTFEPNVRRRGGVPVSYPLRQENAFRPDLNDIADFLKTAKKPKAIFLNSPHNPTGGIATKEDLKGIADLVRGRDIAVFSDEPYCHMVWGDRHRSILAEPGMLDHCIGAYTFSKSYSMSGWRLGYAIGSARNIELIGKMINTTLSCVPPINQLAGMAALQFDAAERDETMAKFKVKVDLLVGELRKVEGVTVLNPAGTFYVFPNVSKICQKLGIRSHGLAMYLLEGADPAKGVACLGGECFGAAGKGFLRFSCAEPDDRLVQAVTFFAEAITKTNRVNTYLEAHPEYRLA
ncbi:pyridoxal phosphate-dependent aminotransferase [Zavarzinella formosa]|uniref:pyridoxal phosphate-dependent aminotransferase n=1 Tax=Zavarzinella formosa TaxID=360055 RepID=UPI0002EEDAAB|nr:aminotransferase class I/II-fold pyridoxal phosphate-dependent enzyme [Zavarzinella formosa]